MIIEGITVRNFGAYAGEQRLRPGHRTAAGGAVTLVGGMNGYGKTSLLEAVLLALYGERSPAVRERGQGRYAAYLKDLAHRGAPPDTEIGVQLDLALPGADGLSKLQIRRSWRATSPRKTETLTILRDGREDTHLAEHWDTYVEEVVPSGIAGLFFFDGERISELAESEETTAALRQAIRSLLGLETVDRLIADLDLVIRRNRARLKDERVKQEMERRYQEVRQVEEVIAVTRQQLAALQNATERATLRYREAEAAFALAGGELAAGRAKLIAQREQLTGALAELRAEMGTLAAGALPLLLVKSQLRRIATTVREEEAAAQARIALPILHEHDRVILAELERGAVDSALLAHIERLIGKQQLALAEQAARPATFPLSPTGAAQIGALVAGSLDDLRAQASEIVKHHSEAEGELHRTDRHLEAEPERIVSADQSDALAALREQLASFESKRAKLEQVLHDHLAKKEAAEKRITEAGGQLAQVEEAERVIHFAARSQETMRTFRERVTRTKIAHLARHILASFDRLTHKQSLVADIRVDPDTLRVSLLDAEANEIPKLRLSSGERQMLALAILWGLGRASGRTLPVIIDTPMGRLDSSHRRTFVTEYLPNASHQVIVLSTDTEVIGAHLDSLNGHVGRRFRLAFDEQQQGTRIVEGYFAPAGV
jgi:DNA sulfur modification protein DndD